MPERVDFWGLPPGWSGWVYLALTLSVFILVYRLYRVFSLWRRTGRAEMRTDHPLGRLKRLFMYAVLQVRTLSQRYPGILHTALFWSFLIFFLGTALATLNSHFFKFLTGGFYLVYKLILDLSILPFLVGAGMAVYRRIILKPARLSLRPGFIWALFLLVFIVLNGLLVEALRLAIQQPAWAPWSPLGWALAQAWISAGLPPASLQEWHQTLYVTHVLTICIFFVTLPTGTLLHLFTAPLNIFYSRPDLSGSQLSPLLRDSHSKTQYAYRLKDLSWKQLLDGDACTECGRCQDVCPAFASGQPLNPKQLILDIRQSLHSNRQLNLSPNLAGGVISAPVLWACTTCGACAWECPLLIEHLDTIVDLRRALVHQGNLDIRLQAVLESLSLYGNVYTQSSQARPHWTNGLRKPLKDARKEKVDYLWFVGDTASYDPIVMEITRQAARVFQAADINFGILYEAENNSGNDARRVGEEGLFAKLAQRNTAIFQTCDFKAILTTDPHSYHTLKNEYPPEALLGRPVFHYTELLDTLISTGSLAIHQKLNGVVTYHDPCYLARFNGITAPPRRVLKALGCEVVEMPRHLERTFCCGAGGGRIWMEEGELKERPSELRIREAASLGKVSRMVVACPKDLVMFRDAAQSLPPERSLVVSDLIELVYEAVK